MSIVKIKKTIAFLQFIKTLNKTKQIIGRGIRHCRHNNLPLEERNMSVYMHASFDNYKKEF